MVAIIANAKVIGNPLLSVEAEMKEWNKETDPKWKNKTEITQ